MSKVEENQTEDVDTSTMKLLMQGGYIIDDDFDERNHFINSYHESKKKKKGLSLTIAPTLSCNYRCVYCYQEHPNRKLNTEDIHHIVRYVEENLEDNTYLGITWFGGEPLIELSKIQELEAELRKVCEERNCTLVQNMISNGHLLDEKALKYIATQNYEYIQITLDGPPEVHNQRRFTVGKKATFDTIVANVQNAVVYGINITIRVNIDKTNFDKLDLLLEEFEEAGLRAKVHIYLGHVWDYTEVCSNINSTCLSREEFAIVESKFQFMQFQKGFSSKINLPKPRQGVICVADNPNGRVYAPGNLWFKCWNEIYEKKEIASGYSDGTAKTPQMEANFKKWDSYDPFTHKECVSCKFAPLCSAGCPWEANKYSPEETGHCTPLKWNLYDKLRIYQLQSALTKVAKESPELVEA